LESLPPCPRRFHSSAGPMPAIARIRRSVSGPLAIRSAIFAALGCGTVATRMSTLVDFLFGHVKPPCPRSIPRQRAKCNRGSEV
jgi:hypothetical protein